MTTEHEYLRMVKLYKLVFGSEQGQQILADLIAKTGYLDVQTDNLEFNAGQRSVMKMILDMVEADYEYVKKLIAPVLKEKSRRLGKHASTTEIFDY